MHRADDHVVVPAAEVVVDVDGEQPVMRYRQSGRVGGSLPTVEGVAEVEQYSDVGQADLFDAEQRARDAGE
jgi:hypothetical protein